MSEPAEGSVLLIPLGNERFIVTQIGKGGDIGIFDAVITTKDVDNVDGLDILFRVDYSRGSARHHNWIDVGCRSLHTDLRSFSSYAYSAVGSNRYFRVTHRPDEFEISKDEFHQLEPLASWSHEHIVERFKERPGT